MSIYRFVDHSINLFFCLVFQSQCTPEEEQEMPRLSQQQTEYSRTLTSMRKERKQFDELEQAFLVYKQSRLNALYPQKSPPTNIEQTSTETIVR